MNSFWTLLIKMRCMNVIVVRRERALDYHRGVPTFNVINETVMPGLAQNELFVPLLRQHPEIAIIYPRPEGRKPNQALAPVLHA